MRSGICSFWTETAFEARTGSVEVIFALFAVEARTGRVLCCGDCAVWVAVLKTSGQSAGFPAQVLARGAGHRSEKRHVGGSLTPPAPGGGAELESRCRWCANFVAVKEATFCFRWKTAVEDEFWYPASTRVLHVPVALLGAMSCDVVGPCGHSAKNGGPESRPKFEAGLGKLMWGPPE